ncbi:hypothetical protein MTBLM5_30198 [Magnetospirillum sp. LM-5]|nr:hypothetical protein MTBLM5_30198 [Magnetospirillum sp. LM-5]
MGRAGRVRKLVTLSTRRRTGPDALSHPGTARRVASHAPPDGGPAIPGAWARTGRGARPYDPFHQ